MSKTESVSRRSLIASIAKGAAATAIGVPALVGTASAAGVPASAATDSVSPELREAVSVFFSKLHELKGARAFRDKAVAAFEKIAPKIPEALVIRPRKGTWGSGRPEYTIEWDRVRPIDPKEPYRMLASSDELLRLTKRYDGRTAPGRYARKTLPIAERYEDAWAEADERVGATAAIDEATRLQREIIFPTMEVFKIEARTMADVRAKATVLEQQTSIYDHLGCISEYGVWLAREALQFSGGLS